MALLLHSYWRATAPYRVRIGLRLKGLAFDYAPVNLLKNEQGAAPYRDQFNRQALVPSLTADGQVRSCLFSRDEADLRGGLRGGATDEELAAAWRTAMWGKAPGHAINDPSFLQPSRPMSAIGG